MFDLKSLSSGSRDQSLSLGSKDQSLSLGSKDQSLSPGSKNRSLSVPSLNKEDESGYLLTDKSQTKSSSRIYESIDIPSVSYSKNDSQEIPSLNNTSSNINDGKYKSFGSVDYEKIRSDSSSKLSESINMLLPLDSINKNYYKSDNSVDSSVDKFDINEIVKNNISIKKSEGSSVSVDTINDYSFNKNKSLDNNQIKSFENDRSSKLSESSLSLLPLEINKSSELKNYTLPESDSSEEIEEVKIEPEKKRRKEKSTEKEIEIERKQQPITNYRNNKKIEKRITEIDRNIEPKKVKSSSSDDLKHKYDEVYNKNLQLQSEIQKLRNEIKKNPTIAKVKNQKTKVKKTRKITNKFSPDIYFLETQLVFNRTIVGETSIKELHVVNKSDEDIKVEISQLKPPFYIDNRNVVLKK